MENQHSGFSGWRQLVLTVVPLLALAFGSVTMLGTETASAVSPSIGVSCSSSNVNGVKTATLRLNVKDAVGLTLVVDGTTTPDSATPITTNPQVVTVGPLSASETFLIGLWDGSSFVRTAEARVVFTSFGVSCSARTPASTPPAPPQSPNTGGAGDNL